MIDSYVLSIFYNPTKQSKSKRQFSCCTNYKMKLRNLFQVSHSFESI